MHVALAALRAPRHRPDGATAAVQGFGKVGRGAARFLPTPGVRVVAVSDQYGARDDARPRHPGAGRACRRDRPVVGFAGADDTRQRRLLDARRGRARPGRRRGRARRGQRRRVKARIVVEGANGPTTPGGRRDPGRAGDVLVVPDILANAGGVIVSYFEWVQANQAYWWSEAEVETRLAERMLTTWEQVNSYAGTRRLSLRSAAMAMAVERVVTAHGLRGLYP